MSDRERLRAELDALVAAHPIPLAVVVWLTEWLIHESDEDLAGWTMRCEFFDSDAVILNRRTDYCCAITLDYVCIDSSLEIRLERRHIPANRGRVWACNVIVYPDGETESHFDPLDDSECRPIVCAGGGTIGQ